jgi:ABC-type transport system substrate-binding protein
VTLNVLDPQLQNKTLRQALSSALDPQEWRDLFAKGLSEEMILSSPVGLEDGSSLKAQRYPFNLAKAKELLAKAGYPGGKGLKPIQLDLLGDDTLQRQLGEMVKKQFAQVGVIIEPILNTATAINEKMKKGNTQLAMMAWTLDYPDVENAYQLLTKDSLPPGYNVSQYSQPQVNEWYSQMKTLLPGSKRHELVEKMENQIQEDVPWIFGYYQGTAYVYQKKLKNMKVNPFIYSPFRFVELGEE